MLSKRQHRWRAYGTAFEPRRRSLTTKFAIPGGGETSARRLVGSWAVTGQGQIQLGRADIERLIVGYAEGNSVPHLVARFKIHRTTVLAHLERNVVPRRPTGPQLNDKDVAKRPTSTATGARCPRSANVFESTLSQSAKLFGEQACRFARNAVGRAGESGHLGNEPLNDSPPSLPEERVTERGRAFPFRSPHTALLRARSRCRNSSSVA